MYYLQISEKKCIEIETQNAVTIFNYIGRYLFKNKVLSSTTNNIAFALMHRQVLVH